MTYLIAFSIEAERERYTVSAMNADLWKDALLLGGQCGWKTALDSKKLNYRDLVLSSCAVWLRHYTKGDVRQIVRPLILHRREVDGDSYCQTPKKTPTSIISGQNDSQAIFKVFWSHTIYMLKIFLSNFIHTYHKTNLGLSVQKSKCAIHWKRFGWRIYF